MGISAFTSGLLAFAVGVSLPIIAQNNSSHSSSSDLPPLATNDSNFSIPSQEANLAYEMEMQQQNTESLG